MIKTTLRKIYKSSQNHGGIIAVFQTYLQSFTEFEKELRGFARGLKLLFCMGFGGVQLTCLSSSLIMHVIYSDTSLTLWVPGPAPPPAPSPNLSDVTSIASSPSQSWTLNILRNSIPPCSGLDIDSPREGNSTRAWLRLMTFELCLNCSP
jgi:hypothetical protein